MQSDQPGAPAGGQAVQSRLIPGSPFLPSMLAGSGLPGLPQGQAAASLLGREVSAVPAQAMTQPLQSVPQLSLGGSATAAAPPVPAGRSVASLRTPRGTHYVRLAFAALFLLGFLGLVGYLLKDYLPGVFPSLLGRDTAEEVTVKKSTPGSKPT
jgi:hypothetical protein